MMTLTAPTGPLESEVTRPVRPISDNDRNQLAELYAQTRAGTTGPDVTRHHGAALEDVLHDRQHPVIPEASLVSVDAEGQITACIVVIKRPSKDGGAGTAFITELFTHPQHRRQGLAEDLLRCAIDKLHATGWPAVAVTLDSTNAAAMALYLSMDFRRW
jgi:ribosomal protein S18 acetylase RimI-like enzyme